MTRHVRDVCGHLGSTAHNPTESIWGFELFSHFSSSKYHIVFNLHSASQTGIRFRGTVVPGGGVGLPDYLDVVSSCSLIAVLFAVQYMILAVWFLFLTAQC